MDFLGILFNIKNRLDFVFFKFLIFKDVLRSLFCEVSVVNKLNYIRKL